jgi:GNAT superfamily N-acetyltransferase
MAELANEISEGQQPFYLGLTCSLDESTSKEQMEADYQAGVRLIQWRDPAGQLESLIKTLWDVAESGVWNHLEIPAEAESSMAQGLIRFIEANPNIAHSSTRYQLPNLPLKSPAEQTEEASGTYSQVAKLPGEPFWQKVNDPIYLLLYLIRYGIKKVMRWRVRNDGCSIYSIGKDVEFRFVKPSELPAGYMGEICRMVEAGGSVGAKWVRYNLERAFLIGYVLEQGVIIGNSSLKQPRPEYVETVKRQSGLDLSHYLERGYTSVRPEYRGLGIGTKLLEGLTSRAGHRKIFSIISEDNLATKKIAIRNRTRKVASYYSERMGKQIGIWMPEWMIED